MAMTAVRALRQKTVPMRPDRAPMTVAPDDPLGLDLQQRGMENARQHAMPFGPLPDPRWAGFFQALADAGVDKIAAGPSAPGSNQLRGRSVQPSFIGGGTAGDALEGVRTSMPWYVAPPPPPKEQPQQPQQPPKTKAPEPPPKDQGRLLPHDFTPYRPQASGTFGNAAAIAALRRSLG